MNEIHSMVAMVEHKPHRLSTPINTSHCSLVAHNGSESSDEKNETD